MKFDKNMLLFIGDIHGDFHFLNECCYKVEKSLIVQVGDCGLGFRSVHYEEEHLKKINNTCIQYDNHLLLLFGNHDSRERFSLFREKNTFSNITFLNDYDIVNYKNKTIQFIGGAISIDRTGRTLGTSYWENEGVVFNRESCKKVDILVTHTAPSFCSPQSFNEMVYGWAREDAYLLEDLTDERAVMDEIFKICSPKYHFYGHFHFSHSETIKNCTHKLLDINEFFELRDI
jgi:hypothetical protein